MPFAEDTKKPNDASDACSREPADWQYQENQKPPTTHCGHVDNFSRTAVKNDGILPRRSDYVFVEWLGTTRVETVGSHSDVRSMVVSYASTDFFIRAYLK